MLIHLISWPIDDRSYNPLADIAEARLEIEVRPYSVEAWIRLGHGLYGKYLTLTHSNSEPDHTLRNEAIEALEFALLIQPKHPKALLYLGQIYSPFCKIKSRYFLYRYYEVAPTDTAISIQIATELYLDRDFPTAIEIFSSVLEQDPSSKPAREFLIGALTITKGDSVADKFLAKWNEDPLSYEWLKRKAYSHLFSGNPARALSLVLKMHELHVENTHLSLDVANLVHGKEQFETLIQWCEKRLLENPNHPILLRLRDAYASLDSGKQGSQSKE